MPKLCLCEWVYADQLEEGVAIDNTILPLQESFTLEKYVEKLAQLNPDTGLGPLHRSKDKSTPFDPEVPIYWSMLQEWAN